MPYNQFQQLKRGVTVANLQKKPFGGSSEGFSLQKLNFSARMCNELGFLTYKL